MVDSCKGNHVWWKMLIEWGKETMWGKRRGVARVIPLLLIRSDSKARKGTWQRNQCWWWYLLSQKRKMFTGCFRLIKTDSKKTLSRKHNSSSYHVRSHDERLRLRGKVWKPNSACRHVTETLFTYIRLGHYTVWRKLTGWHLRVDTSVLRIMNHFPLSQISSSVHPKNLCLNSAGVAGIVCFICIYTVNSSRHTWHVYTT